MHFQLPRRLSLFPFRSHYVLQLYCPRKQVYVFLHHVIVFFLLLYKHNLFYFCPFLNVWVSAVFQNTCFVFCKSLHHKWIPFLAVLTSRWPLLVLSSHSQVSWSVFFRLISFPTTPDFTDVFLIYPFLFFLSAFSFGPSISSISPTRTASSHQMSDVCCLSTFRKLMWKGKGNKPSHCLGMRGVSVCVILALEKKSLCSSFRRNLRTSSGGWYIPHTFVCLLYPLSSQIGCT